jgi:hypothetical protein
MDKEGDYTVTIAGHFHHIDYIASDRNRQESTRVIYLGCLLTVAKTIAADALIETLAYTVQPPPRVWWLDKPSC